MQGKGVPELLGAEPLQEGRCLYSAARFVEGESWDWNSESHRSLDGESLRLLDCMHCLGVLHGDIHRGNIIVTPSQQVVLLDFGHSVYPASPSDMAAEQQWLQDILAIKGPNMKAGTCTGCA